MSNPYEAPQSPSRAAETDASQGYAIASLILGLVSGITWLIPILGLPTTVAGLILGIKGLGPRRRGIAIAGLVLSTIFLVLTLLNAALGAYLAATGQHPLVQ